MSLHPSALRVGKKYKPKSIFTYNDVKYDIDGWTLADDYLPAEFDLCKLKTKENISKMGWWCGNFWEGGKIKDTDEIVLWKRWMD